MTTTTPTPTTGYTARVTRDGPDFLAEMVVWEDGQVVNEVLVGWFDSHARALAAANEEVTDSLQRAAEEAAQLALEARTVLADEQAAKDAEAEAQMQRHSPAARDGAALGEVAA